MMHKLSLPFLLVSLLLVACLPRQEETAENGPITSQVQSERSQIAETGSEAQEIALPPKEDPLASQAGDQMPTAAPSPPTIAAEESKPALSAVRINRRVGTDEEYRLPFFILPKDGIRPIYEPEFVTAGESPYRDEELVMGVAFEDEAKAYPVTVLRFREMVNDELAGIPILVTW